MDFLLSRLVPQHNHTHLIGLEISPDQIKAVKINYSISPFLVENISISPLAAGIVVKDEIKDMPALSLAIKDLFQQGGIQGENVAIAIPRSIAIIKNITVDSRLSAGDIESRAWVEANRYFPDLVGDIYLDFTVTGPATIDPAQNELLLVACRKDHIKPYVEILKQAGLNAAIIDVNCYALKRALGLVVSAAEQKEVSALLNLNNNLSSLVVAQAANLLHAHDQSYDGHRLLLQVKEYLANFDAEHQAPGNLIANQNYLKILNENLVAHLRHTIHLFYTSRPNVNVNKLFLSGDCATIPGISEYVQHELNIPSEIADPFMSMQFAANVEQEKVQPYKSALMLCCGLILNKATCATG